MHLTAFIVFNYLQMLVQNLSSKVFLSNKDINIKISCKDDNFITNESQTHLLM